VQKIAEPIDLPFGLWTPVGRKKHKFNRTSPKQTPMKKNNHKLECGPMPSVMAALPNIGGALC